MKLGVNEDVNSIQKSTKTKEIKHMDDDRPKVHRLVVKSKKSAEADIRPSTTARASTNQHEAMKIGTFAIIGTLAFGLAWYLR